MNSKSVVNVIFIVLVIGVVLVLINRYSPSQKFAHDIQESYEYKKYIDLYQNSPYSDEYMRVGECYNIIKLASRMNYGRGTMLREVNSLRTQPILTILGKIHMRFDALEEINPEYAYGSDLTYYLFKSKIAMNASYSKWVLQPSSFVNTYNLCVSEYK